MERLILESKAELFNNRIGQDLSRDALDFRLGLGSAQPTVERKLKKFALADSVQPFEAHFLQCTMDCLALRIKDTLLERYENKGSHEKAHYTSLLRLAHERQITG